MSPRSHASVHLFREAQNGSSRAREALFERLHPLVHELVRRRMGPRLRHAVESVDVVQSVLADALTGLERFEPDGDGALLRWLTRIAENKLRKQARRMRYGDRDPQRGRRIGPDSEGGGFEASARTSRPSQGLVRAEERSWLLELIERLPARERTLVRLRRLEQLDWPAILERSGETNLKAARGAFARGMARLANWAADPGNPIRAEPDPG